MTDEAYCRANYSRGDVAHRLVQEELEIGGKGGYLGLVEALEGCLLARDCAISTVRFEEASIEKSSECYQTAGDFKSLGPGDECNRKSGRKGNDDKECKKDQKLLEAGG